MIQLCCLWLAALPSALAAAGNSTLLAHWTHRAAQSSMQRSVAFIARHPTSTKSHAFQWEPEWTTEVATVPILGELAAPECLAACGDGRRCCARCGFYARGSWQATDDPSVVPRAVGLLEVKAPSKGHPELAEWRPMRTSLSVNVSKRYRWAHAEGGPGERCEAPAEAFSALAACRAVCGRRCMQGCERKHPGGLLHCNATLVGLGDSTVRSQVAALANMVRAVGTMTLSTHQGSAAVSCPDPDRGLVIHLEMFAVQSINYRERTLASAGVSTLKLIGIDLSVVLRRSDVVLVNTGPFQKVNWGRGQPLLNKLHSLQLEIRESSQGLVAALGTCGFQGKLVFRTTTRGHPFCWEPSFQRPHRDPASVAGPWLRLKGIGNRTVWNATRLDDSSASANSSLKITVNSEEKYFKEVAEKFQWQFFPLTNRLFAAELTKAVLEAVPRVELLLLDDALMGELSSHGKNGGNAAPHAAARGQKLPPIGGDCLHFSFPSLNLWLNAFLVRTLSDDEADG